MGYFAEITEYKDGKYSIVMQLGEDKFIEDLHTCDNYVELKNMIRARTGISLPDKDELNFHQISGRKIAFIDKLNEQKNSVAANKSNREENIMEQINAEYIPFLNEYRLYDPNHPEKTIAYADSLEEAREQAGYNGYDKVVECDSDTMHVEVSDEEEEIEVKRPRL